MWSIRGFDDFVALFAVTSSLAGSSNNLSGRWNLQKRLSDSSASAYLKTVSYLIIGYVQSSLSSCRKKESSMLIVELHEGYPHRTEECWWEGLRAPALLYLHMEAYQWLCSFFINGYATSYTWSKIGFLAIVAVGYFLCEMAKKGRSQSFFLESAWRFWFWSSKLLRVVRQTKSRVSNLKNLIAAFQICSHFDLIPSRGLLHICNNNWKPVNVSKMIHLVFNCVCAEKSSSHSIQKTERRVAVGPSGTISVMSDVSLISSFALDDLGFVCEPGLTTRI